MMSFSQKVLKVVEQIPTGQFLTYQEVAKKAGNKRASRAVGQILAQNYNPLIPCHRVIQNNYEIGGYHGSFRNSYQKAGLLLKEGAIGVIPTDTIYGICGSALKKEVVEKIYHLRKRNFKKPMIILLSSIDDLQYFHIRLNPFQKRILKQLWPGPVSVILKCPQEKFSYLHRGIKTLAFRIPRNQELLKILRIAGPLVAPSANFEGEKPAATIKEAKRYFQDKVFYYDKGILISQSSTLIDLTSTPVKILRKGKGLNTVEKVLKNGKIKTSR